MKRQQIRKLFLLLALLLFPITIWYFSPALIMNALYLHILNGSFIVFSCMFVFALFFGRFFCGYLCPMGGMQECIAEINNKPAKAGWRNYIKFGIWIIWLGLLAFFYFAGEGDLKIDFFFMTDHGISIAEIGNYVIYYGVIVLIFLPTLIHGRRASCHYICWMAPFMIVGSKLGKALHIPQLHVKAEKEKCISCGICNKNCPMGLDVKKMVNEKGTTYNAECINCGKCIDNCPKKVLSYSAKFN